MSADSLTALFSGWSDIVGDDLASVSLQMEGGVVGTLCMGRIGNASHPDIGEIKLRLLGSRRPAGPTDRPERR